LKFYNKTKFISGSKPTDIWVGEDNSPCINNLIRVMFDRFPDDSNEHYVHSLEDNWISKEFMSLVFDEKYSDRN